MSHMRTENAPMSKTRHPGQFLKELMEQHGVNEAQIAESTGLSRPLINQILHGNRRITAATALLLARCFKVEPQEFLNEQLVFDLAEAKQSIGSKIEQVVPVSG